MPAFKDITGQRFGKLVAVKVVGKTGNGIMKWLCSCDCGNEKIVSSWNLVSGHTESCGCISKMHPHNLRHGGRHTKLYGVWRSMKQRCYLRSSDSYKYYGAKGISVCDEWQSFEPFWMWSLLNGYAQGLSIDRIDSSGNYCPENCRWTSPLVQGNNTSRNRIIEINGQSKTMSEWARHFGITYSSITKMIQRNTFDSWLKSRAHLYG